MKDYLQILEKLKSQIRLARLQAVVSANAVLLKSYWQIGNTILQQQSTEDGAQKLLTGFPQTSKKHFLI